MGRFSNHVSVRAWNETNIQAEQSCEANKQSEYSNAAVVVGYKMWLESDERADFILIPIILFQNLWRLVYIWLISHVRK